MWLYKCVRGENVGLLVAESHEVNFFILEEHPLCLTLNSLMSSAVCNFMADFKN